MFPCFVNDLPGALQTNALMFADDVKMYSRVDTAADVSAMQRQIDRLCHWSETWGLKLNATKCKVLTLTLKRAPVIGDYTIGGVLLERVHAMTARIAQSVKASVSSAGGLRFNLRPARDVPRPAPHPGVPPKWVVFRLAAGFPLTVQRPRCWVTRTSSRLRDIRLPP